MIISTIEQIVNVQTVIDNVVSLEINEAEAVMIETLIPGIKGNPGTIVAVQAIAPSNPSIGDLWVEASI